MTLNTPLLDALRKAAQKPHAAFYAPGHKQGKGIDGNLLDLLGSQVFQADLPELPELDNLYAPEGVIEEAQQLAAKTYGAAKTWFLVNGSTCGIVAAILATCSPGDKLILPRNIHQSAIAGLVLAGAEPVFIQPEYNHQEHLALGVIPESLEQTLAQHPDAKAVLLLHPNYQGVCSDLVQLIEIIHRYNLPVLVDEAHGAHFAFHAHLPPSAMSAGADLAVQSTHKVLSAMTQASMLHLQGNLVSDRKISRALQLIQSTSPSYLLLASLDAARQQMAVQGKELMQQTLTLANRAREKLSTIPGIAVFEPPISPGCQTLDRTRLTINVSGLGMTGFAADEILHQQLKVTCELPLLHHLTFIISLGNSAADIQLLVQAVQSLSQQLDVTPQEQNQNLLADLSTNLLDQPLELKLNPRDAYFATATTVTSNQAIGQVCGELICPYPPGIPLLMPGEIITESAIYHLEQILRVGGTVTGCKDPSLKTIGIIK